MTPPDLPPTLRRITGQTPTHFTPVRGGGYTPALRLIAHFPDHTTAFVKRATTADTATWLRAEHHAYTTLANAPFLPKFLGYEDSPTPTFLLEDLSECSWHHTWTESRVRAVLDLLATVRTHPHANLPSASIYAPHLTGWPLVAADPNPFLSLNLCTPQWLDAHLPALLAAESATSWTGPHLCHFDIRSDNICFRPDSTPLLIDWNHACTGNGLLDFASWLPSLHAEGGPLPDTILPNPGPLPAKISGYWAARAGLPEPFPTSTVREIQLTQLKVALPWTARALGLPPPTPC